MAGLGRVSSSEETMAEILALGISHYPPLTGHDNRMARILRRMMQNPDLPANLRTPEGWPEAMRTEWGDDEGTTSAARHRADLVGWMQQTRAALDAFDPDFVLIWGDDQYRELPRGHHPAVLHQRLRQVLLRTAARQRLG